ncbi:MAG: rod shape-determining protein MreC [Candidatus Dormibacteria bacterium]
MRRGSQLRTTSYLVIAVAMGIVLVTAGQRLHVEAARGVAATVFAPLEGALSSVGDSVRGAWSTLNSIGTLRTDNERLRQEVANLQRQLATARENSLNDAQLKQLLALRDGLQVHAVGAAVIGHDPEGIAQVLTIHAGTRQGVRRGMAVLGLRGLVGRISDVQGSTSKVQLISDPDSPVNIELATTHLGGTMHLAETRIVADLLNTPVDLKVDVGELLLTSGIGGNFPKGLPVASVVRFNYQPYGVTQVAEVAPLDDLRRLEYVMVDTDFMPVVSGP